MTNYMNIPALAVALLTILGANAQTSTTQTTPITPIAGTLGKVVQADSSHAYVMDASGVRYDSAPNGQVERAHGVLLADYSQENPVSYPFGEPVTDIVTIGGSAYFQMSDYITGGVNLWTGGSTPESSGVLLSAGSQVIVDGKAMVFFGGFKPLNLNGQLVEIGYWGNSMKAVSFTPPANYHMLVDYGAINYVVDAAASNGCIIAVVMYDPQGVGTVQRTCGANTTAVGSIPNLGLDENWEQISYPFSLTSTANRNYWMYQNSAGGLTFSNIGDTEPTATNTVLGSLIGNAPVSNIWDLKLGGDGTTAFVMQIAGTDGRATAGGFTIGASGTTTLQVQPPFGSVGLFLFGGQIFAHSGDNHLSWDM